MLLLEDLLLLLGDLVPMILVTAPMVALQSRSLLSARPTSLGSSVISLNLCGRLGLLPYLLALDIPESSLLLKTADLTIKTVFWP